MTKLEGIEKGEYDEVIIVKPDGTVSGEYTSFGVVQAYHNLSKSGKENVIKGLKEAIKGNPALLDCVVNKRGKPEVWIESRLENDMGLTPKRVANECMYYFGIDKKMLPHLIRLAQRVKHRLRKRLGANGLYVPNSRKKSEVESPLGYWQ